MKKTYHNVFSHFLLCQLGQGNYSKHCIFGSGWSTVQWKEWNLETNEFKSWLWQLPVL